MEGGPVPARQPRLGGRLAGTGSSQPAGSRPHHPPGDRGGAGRLDTPPGTDSRWHPTLTPGDHPASLDVLARQLAALEILADRARDGQRPGPLPLDRLADAAGQLAEQTFAFWSTTHPAGRPAAAATAVQAATLAGALAGRVGDPYRAAGWATAAAAARVAQRPRRRPRRRRSAR